MLNSSLNSQPVLLIMFSKKGDMTEANFAQSWYFAQAKHQYSDGEFKNIAEVVAEFYSNNTNMQIPLPCYITKKCISQISAE